MTDKRRDKKGRILLSGERQRSNGMYEYRYIDANGDTKSVYSWKLVKTDKPPSGKKSNEALRDIVKRISRDMDDGIDSSFSMKTSLNSFYDEYIATKYELKQSTRTNYQYMYNKYIRDDFGKKKIADIKYSDVKKLYIHLITDLGFKPNSVENINTILHPVFTSAVRDGKIRINPSDGVLAEIKKCSDWSKPKRHALTIQQQNAFMSYCSKSSVYSHWLPLFTVFLGTGGRVGEIIGLTWGDCDFDKDLIYINHNLIYRVQDSGMCEFHITTPKTKAGTRVIPMLAAVKESLMMIYESQKETGRCNSIIDGYKDFVFCNRFNNVITPHSINRAIDRIVRDYNMEELMNAKSEGRESILLPHFSVHNLRHTFCTRYCENETNIKIIQEIMGHADITTTMDVYNEATIDKKMESFVSLEGKIKI